MELQRALRQLLLRDGEPRWDRLENLLEIASGTDDYDVGQALDLMLKYLSTEQGEREYELVYRERGRSSFKWEWLMESVSGRRQTRLTSPLAVCILIIRFSVQHF